MGKINLNNKIIKQQPNELLTESAQGAENNAANAAEAMDIFKKFNRQSNSDNAEKEIVELRTINSKSVRTKEGTVRQTIFPSAVHYVDENGIMQDIDNTLIERGDSYVINNGESGVKLAKNLYDKTLLSLKTGDTELNWKYLPRNSNQFCALSVNNGMKKAESECNAKACESKGLFSDVEKGVDLEYKFDCGNIKENFIVKERLDSYSFAFELETKGIEPRLSENGKSIEFVANIGTDSEKVIYTIPTPYMYDSKGNFSADVSYEIDDLGSGKYTFTIVADDSWINAANRAFPVVIDPMIQSSYSLNADCELTHTNFETGEVTKADNIGAILLYQKDRMTTSVAYINFNPSGDVLKIKKAKLVISLAIGQGGKKFTINDQVYDYEKCFPIIMDVKDSVKADDILVLDFNFNRAEYDALNATFFFGMLFELEIEYYDNNKFYNEDISLLENIYATFHAKKGTLKPYFTNSKTKKKDFIKHNYNASYDVDRSCGNFRLNLDEYFIMTDNDSIRYEYFDEFGDSYGYKELFYYYENGEVVAVDRNEVTAKADGSLFYNDFKVRKTVILDNGLRAITQYIKVKNFGVLDQRIEKEKKLQEQVDAYYDIFKDFIGLVMTTDEIKYFTHYTNSSERMDTFFNDSKLVKLTTAEINNYKLLCSQRVAIFKQIQSNEIQKESIEIDIRNIKDNVKINNLRRQISHLGYVNDDLNKQGDLINENIKYLLDKSKIYEEQLRNYFKIYWAKNDELIALKRSIPVSFLTDGENIRGFNREGYLVAIFDNKNNYTLIERNESNEATHISDNVGNELKLFYLGRKISQIIDQENNIINYTYNGDKLIKVQQSVDDIVKFVYENNNLTSIETLDGNVEIEYVSNKVSKLNIETKMINISHNTVNSNAQKTKEIIFTYSTDKTILQEDNRKYIFCRKVIDSSMQKDYIVEENGKVKFATVFIEDIGIKKKQMSAKKSILNNLSFEEFQFDAEEIVTQLYNTIGYVSENTFEKHIKYDVYGTTVKLEKVAYNYDEDNRIKNTTTTTSLTMQNGTVINDLFIMDYFYDDDSNLIRTEGYYIDEKATKGVNVCEYVYCANSELLKEIQYNTLESTSKVIKEYKYDENNNLIGEYDESGDNLYNYEFSLKYGDLSLIKQPNGSQIAYGYDNNGNLTSISSNTKCGEANHNELYYTRDHLTKMVSGNNTVEYSYDHKGRQTFVKLNSDTPYVNTVYTDDFDLAGKKVDIAVSNYDNGYMVGVMKNEDGNVILSQVLKDSIIENSIKYTYNRCGDVESIKNENTSNIINLNYDSNMHYIGYTQTLGLNENIEYDIFGNIIKESYNLGDINGSYDYTYSNDADNLLTEIAHKDTTVKIKHDVLGRNKGKEIFVGDNKIADESIYYKKSGDNTTGLVSSIRYGNNVNGKAMNMDGVKYEYDSVSNITKVFQNGELISTYDYDYLGRLTRENHKKAALTFVYEYDNNGNIITKRTYPYTLGDVEEKDCEELIRYGYDGDKLMLWNDLNFEYDSIGNPTVYRGKAAIWSNVRQLQSYDGVIFTYDEVTGLRKSKNDIEYLYFLDGRLLSQSNGIQFFYDHTGVAGIEQGTTKFYYRKNAQGDVISILDSNGEVVVQYVYDAWGNHSVCNADGTENSDIAFIGNINPFRYRSYYYDTETGLYYLKTRYYDPQIGRFMNADDIAYLNPESINGLNLYAYCGNNPIMNIDPNGNAFLSILLLGFLMGAFVGGITGTVSGIAEGKTGWDLVGHIAGGAILGGVFGSATFLGGALGVGALATTTGNILGGLAVASVGAFGAGILNYGLQEVWTVDNVTWDWSKALTYGGIAAVQGLTSFGIGAAMGGAGMWKSLKPGNGFIFTIKSFVQNVIGQTNKISFKAIFTSVAKGSIYYLKSNIGQMVGRVAYKSLFLMPWGLIRWAI